jgi:hypothetical protein
MAHPILFEINTRCWLHAVSEKYRTPTTLANIPDQELAAWERLGFSHVWLMGVWTSGPRARAQALSDPRQRQVYSQALPDWAESDVVGSPYAIGQYDVPQDLGGAAGLEKFRGKLQARGFKLLLDFVPNHVGLDHPWLTKRPELFVQSQAPVPETFRQETESGTRYIAHGKDPYFSAWADTAQLDYRRTETRAAMRQLLEKVAERCDGVRCDMAMLLLGDVFNKTWGRFPISNPEPATEFWADAITAVKNRFPGFIFLAEAYWGTESRLQALGFDFTYDKALYDMLIAHNATGVQRHLVGMSPKNLIASAHFLENHDEPRIASLLALDEHRAAALVVLGLPGMRFLHDGQLAGVVRRVPVQLARRAAEPVQPAIEKMYQHLLTSIAESTVGQGNFQLPNPRAAWADNPTAQNFVLVQWYSSAPNFDLVVVNLAPHRSQCYAPLRLPNDSTSNWVMRDLLGTEEFVRSGQELQRQGLFLDLPAHGAQLFHFEPHEV